ncbi:MAG TPA: M56 family metallopeptidase [Candidatus Limnocylindrales bacterium]|nr:M56 family metallopeptidase [Candidatus Limnocylindrales bacterium]
MNLDLFAHLWQSTCFALAAGLLTLAFRRNRAGIRYALWFAASVKFLLPFQALIALGARVHSPASVAERIATPVIAYVVETVTRPAAPHPVEWHRPALFALWASGALALVVFRFRGWLRIRAAVRDSKALPIAAPVEVRSSALLVEPGIVGFLRPTLLLPDGIAARLTAAQFEAVLAHELCHVRRRDNLLSAVHMLVETMFWFHPAIWWIGARLIEEREHACDEAVLRLGNQPRVYAEAIVSVCKLYAESPLACVPGVTGSNLKRRIEAIMKNRTVPALSRAKQSLLAAAAVATLAIPAIAGFILGSATLPVLAWAQPPRYIAPVQPMPAPRPAPSPAPSPQPAGTRMAILLDFGGTTPAERVQLRDAALAFVRDQIPLGATVAVMASTDGRLRVTQDFTASRAAINAAIGKVSAQAEYSAPFPLNPNVRTQASDAVSAVGGAVVRYFGKAAAPADPVAAFYGSPFMEQTLVNALESEFRGAGTQPTGPVRSTQFARILTAVAGLPERSAYMATRPAGEQQTLNIPLDSFSGRVEILAQIKTLDSRPVAAVRDSLTPKPESGSYVCNFTLRRGSYECTLVVADGSGKAYGERILFDVK